MSIEFSNCPNVDLALDGFRPKQFECFSHLHLSILWLSCDNQCNATLFDNICVQLVEIDFSIVHVKQGPSHEDIYNDPFLNGLASRLSNMCEYKCEVYDDVGNVVEKKFFSDEAVDMALQTLKIKLASDVAIGLKDLDWFHQWDFLMRKHDRAFIARQQDMVYSRLNKKSGALIPLGDEEDAETDIKGSALVSLLKANHEMHKKKGKYRAGSTSTKEVPKKKAKTSTMQALMKAEDDDDALFSEDEKPPLCGEDIE